MNQRSDNIPALRFPEFEGEWMERQYRDIYTFHSTNSFSRDMLNYDSGKVKNIRNYSVSFELSH